MPTRVSPAKLNLFLEVTGRRSDGYHDIVSVFVEIDLADTLHAEPDPDGTTTLQCDDPRVPTGSDNLILRAANLLRDECGGAGGIRFRLEKRIPMGGGLGGGSSNAAAALRLANELWRTGLSDGELAELGARIGSDVPFFLRGGTCLCEGRGERVTPLAPFPARIPLGLALCGIHSDTAAAYRGLVLPDPDGCRRPDAFIAAMERADVDAMADAAFNRFEPTVFAAIPALRNIHGKLEQTLHRPVRMSGSGSGLWFFGAVPDGAADKVPDTAIIPASAR